MVVGRLILVCVAVVVVGVVSGARASSGLRREKASPCTTTACIAERAKTTEAKLTAAIKTKANDDSSTQEAVKKAKDNLVDAKDKLEAAVKARKKTMARATEDIGELRQELKNIKARLEEKKAEASASANAAKKPAPGQATDSSCTPKKSLKRCEKCRGGQCGDGLFCCAGIKRCKKKENQEPCPSALEDVDITCEPSKESQETRPDWLKDQWGCRDDNWGKLAPEICVCKSSVFNKKAFKFEEQEYDYYKSWGKPTCKPATISEEETPDAEDQPKGQDPERELVIAKMDQQTKGMTEEMKRFFDKYRGQKLTELKISRDQNLKEIKPNQPTDSKAGKPRAPRNELEEEGSSLFGSSGPRGLQYSGMYENQELRETYMGSGRFPQH